MITRMDPFIMADDLDARLQGARIDAHPVDGAGSGTLTVGGVVE